MEKHSESRRSGRQVFRRAASIVVAAVGVAMFIAISPTLAQKGPTEKVTKESVDKLLADWPTKCQEVAQATIKRHGLPDEATPTRLVWLGNGPWRWSVLYRKEIPHNFPVKHTDMLEQSVNYKVPEEKLSQLAVFDGAVTVRITEGEISAMCDKEDMNYLALNFAHEVITGKKNVEEARAFQAKSVLAYLKGEKHPYTQKLIFEPAKGGTGYPDHEAKKR